MTAHGSTTFDAVLEPLEWGRNTYTIIKVPAGLAGWAKAASTRRLEGKLDDIAVNVGLNRADVVLGDFFYVGRALQLKLGVRTGEVVRCQLAPADPDHVPLAEDIAEALEREGRRDAFERRSASQRRRLLASIDGAVRPATRQRRIAALITALPAD